MRTEDILEVYKIAISLIRPEWIAYGKQYSNNYLIEEFYRVKKLTWQLSVI